MGRDEDGTRVGSFSDDARVRARNLALISTWSAEPRILRAWADDSGNPTLVDTYTDLAARAEGQLAEIEDLLPEQLGAERGALDDAAQRVVREAVAIHHELSRVKWLRTKRQERLDAAPTMRRLIDVDAHARERDELDGLLQALARHLC